MTSMTSSDDATDHQLTISPVLTSESRDSSDMSLHVVVGVLVCSCLLVVTALTVYLCSVVRLYRHRRPVPADDVINHVTTPTAVTSLSSSARSKEVEDTGLLKSLIGSGSTGDGDEAVTWYGSRDVEVGRPTDIRYVSLRRCARQSSSIDSESGMTPPPASQVTKGLTPGLPKRFGFVGWTRTATPAPPSDCLRHQSSSDAAMTSVNDDSPKTLAATDYINARYCNCVSVTCEQSTEHAVQFSV